MYKKVSLGSSRFRTTTDCLEAYTIRGSFGWQLMTVGTPRSVIGYGLTMHLSLLSVMCVAADCAAAAMTKKCQLAPFPCDL